MNKEKIEEMLRGKSDKELREFIKKTKECKRSTGERVDAIRLKFWKLRNVRDNLDRVRKQAQLARGRRKGTDCPALTGNDYSYECEVRLQWTKRYSKEEIMTAFCHSCRLTREKVKEKLVWKGVFETR